MLLNIFLLWIHIILKLSKLFCKDIYPLTVNTINHKPPFYCFVIITSDSSIDVALSRSSSTPKKGSSRLYGEYTLKKGLCLYICIFLTMVRLKWLEHKLWISLDKKYTYSIINQ